MTDRDLVVTVWFKHTGEEGEEYPHRSPPREPG